MKVLVAIACFVAVASAAYYPLVGPNGVPVEPAENIRAKAEHAAAHIAAGGGDVYAVLAPYIHYAGIPYVPRDTPEVAAAKAAHYAAHAAAGHPLYSVVSPYAYAPAVPQDTPEVAAAKAAHLAAHAALAPQNAAPVDTPEVATAKAAHLAAHAAARAGVIIPPVVYAPEEGNYLGEAAYGNDGQYRNE